MCWYYIIMKPSLQHCGTICRQETPWVQNSHLIFLPIQKFSPFQVPEKKYRPFCKSIMCRTRSLTNTFAEQQRFSEPCVLALEVKTICKRNAALSLELTRCIFFFYTQQTMELNCSLATHSLLLSWLTEETLQSY